MPDDLGNNTWQTLDGKRHYDQGTADMHEKNLASGGGGAGGIGGLGGIFLALFIIGPIIIAKIVGFIWGLLLKFGVVGKILTTLLMLIVGPFFCWFIIGSAGRGLQLGNSVFYFMFLGSAFLGAGGYFCWHYDTVKEMEVTVFSGKVKKFAMFVWFGFIAALIISLFMDEEIAAFVSLGASIAGFIYYFIATRPYAKAAAEKRKHPRYILKAIIMLVAAGLTTVFSLQNINEEVEKNARRAAKRNAITAPIVEAAQKASTHDIFVRVSKNYSDKGTPVNSKPVPSTSSWDTVVIWVKAGGRLKVTGEAITENFWEKDYHFIPIEYDGVRGFIDAEYLALE